MTNEKNAATTAATTNEPAFGTPEADSQKTQVLPIPEKVYTNDKIEALRKSYAEKFASMATLTDHKQQQAAMLETFKINSEIESEIKTLKTTEIAAATEAAKQARLTLLTDVLAAQLVLAQLPKNANEADKNSATDKFNSAKTAIEDVLLSKFAHVKKAANVTEGDKPAGNKGATGAEIVSLHVANLAGGMTPAESKAAIVTGGHSRGTTGAVVLAWEREQGLK